MSTTNQALADLATHYWKLCAAFEHKIDSPSDEAMLRYARGRLEAILGGEGLELRTFDGQEWNATCPAAPLNAEEICGAAARIDRTLEPTVLHGGAVLNPGKVMLALAHSNENAETEG